MSATATRTASSRTWSRRPERANFAPKSRFEIALPEARQLTRGQPYWWVRRGILADGKRLYGADLFKVDSDPVPGQAGSPPVTFNDHQLTGRRRSTAAVGRGYGAVRPWPRRWRRKTEGWWRIYAPAASLGLARASATGSSSRPNQGATRVRAGAADPVRRLGRAVRHQRFRLLRSGGRRVLREPRRPRRARRRDPVLALGIFIGEAAAPSQQRIDPAPRHAIRRQPRAAGTVTNRSIRSEHGRIPSMRLVSAIGLDGLNKEAQGRSVRVTGCRSSARPRLRQTSSSSPRRPR